MCIRHLFRFLNQFRNRIQTCMKPVPQLINPTFKRTWMMKIRLRNTRRTYGWICQITKRKARVSLMDHSLVLCLVTSGALIRETKTSSIFRKKFHFSGILGPLAIISNSLLFLLPNDSTQRSTLCGLLIQVMFRRHIFLILASHYRRGRQLDLFCFQPTSSSSSFEQFLSSIPTG